MNLLLLNFIGWGFLWFSSGCSLILMWNTSLVMDTIAKIWEIDGLRWEQSDFILPQRNSYQKKRNGCALIFFIIFCARLLEWSHHICAFFFAIELVWYSFQYAQLNRLSHHSISGYPIITFIIHLFTDDQKHINITIASIILLSNFFHFSVFLLSWYEWRWQTWRGSRTYSL